MPSHLPITLSTCRVETGIQRISPRPLDRRNATYSDDFDWNTLFYDVYRVGREVVFQGPPMDGFLDHLKKTAPFAAPFSSPLRWLWPQARYFGQHKRGEIWLRSDLDRFTLDGPLGHFDIAVQPNHADRFAGQRVLLTISKNNEVRWIVDWLRFHQIVQGATAAILYNNNSTIYSVPELQRHLTEAVPGMDVLVIDWPFPYGPQGGPAGAINGVEGPWDSDYCQEGILQHARWRFLLKARSVMHNDIDEMVLSQGSRSVFEAAEQGRGGMVKFEGRWISVATPSPIDRTCVRHADFVLDEGPDAELSPPKWCVRPQAFSWKNSWSVHNIRGTKANQHITDEFLFRHLRGVTTSWKYDRWAEAAPDPATLPRDIALEAAFAAAGLERSAGMDATGEGSLSGHAQTVL